LEQQTKATQMINDEEEAIHTAHLKKLYDKGGTDYSYIIRANSLS
jgi:hypothetical protein